MEWISSVSPEPLALMSCRVFFLIRRRISVGRAKLLNVQSAVFTIDGSCNLHVGSVRAVGINNVKMLNQENIYKNSVQVEEVLRTMYNPLHFFKGI